MDFWCHPFTLLVHLNVANFFFFLKVKKLMHNYAITMQLDLSSGLDLLRCLATGQWRRIPSWFTRFFLRCLLLFTFTALFLYVRVKLNKGPPIFSM